eukprot:Skav204810  [mRNA]  locus=scaffold894:126495:127728:+ [translate_table: standard]
MLEQSTAVARPASTSVKNMQAKWSIFLIVAAQSEVNISFPECTFANSNANLTHMIHMVQDVRAVKPAAQE